LVSIQLNTKTFTPDGAVNRELVISFQSDRPAQDIKVSIYTVNGRRQIELQPEGVTPDYIVRWNGEDDSGKKLPAGIYIYQIEAGESAYRGVVVLAR